MPVPDLIPLIGDDLEEKARLNKASGYRCTQQICCTFAEKLHEDRDWLLRATLPFGSGMGRGSVCGCVVGAIMILGLRYAPVDVTDKAARRVLLKKQNLFFKRFEDRYGSILCYDLTARARKESGMDIPADGSYFSSSCIALIAETCNILDDILQEDRPAILLAGNA